MNLRALLELMRVSNLPTVWSNAWYGWVAGIYVLVHLNAETAEANAFTDSFVSVFPSVLLQASFAAIAISLLYCGGMILNDYLDRHTDLDERPSRPIPSGRVKPGTAMALAVIFFGVGLAGMVMIEYEYQGIEAPPWRATLFTSVLVLAIVIYNVIHLQSKLGVLVMAACRGLIILACASIKAPPVNHPSWWLFVAGPMTVLILYTLAISIVARREVEPGGPGSPRKFGGPKTIMNMIAAMPLLDAVWLVAMGLWPASLVCVGCSVLTKLGHRKVAGS